MRRFLFGLAVGAVALNVIATPMRVIEGNWTRVAINVALMLVNAWLARWHWKEIRNGRHRQAKEDPRDPPSLATGGVIAGPPHHYSFTVNSAAFTALPEPARPRLELERVKSDLPILAHRVARLTFGQRYLFAPYTDRGGFGVDATATCKVVSPLGGVYLARDPHTAPGLDCSCGFHALPPDVEPWGAGPDLVTLMVELSGTVVEHERGYRAEHQRVVEVQIPPCPFCGDAAQWVQVRNVRKHDAWGSTTSRKCMTGVACPRHRDGDETVTVDDVRRLLGVPVTCQSLPVPKEVES